MQKGIETNIRIIPLAEFPEIAPILAHWSFTEWYRTREISFDIVLKDYVHRSSSNNLPMTFVALSGSLPVGMVSLKNDDLWSRKDLHPWLSALYVHPYFRGQGIGDLLVGTVREEAVRLKYDELFLFLGHDDTIFLESYYASRGWIFFDTALDNDGRPTKIFSLKTT